MTAFAGRNSRAPTNYKRKYNVSKHALDRFRERVDDEFRHRDDNDLMNLLDDKLRNAEQTWDVRDPRAPKEVTKLYAISTRKAGKFYAVVRDETAVTVLDEEMAANNFAGQWKPILSLPFAALKDFVLKPVADVPPGMHDFDVGEGARSVLASPKPVNDSLLALQLANDALRAAWSRKQAAERAFDVAEHELDEAEVAFEVAAGNVVALLELERKP
jgi:hypothetical protein